MAKATLKITDKDDGEIKVKLSFEPEVQASAILTPAQNIAANLMLLVGDLEKLKKLLNEETE